MHLVRVYSYRKKKTKNTARLLHAQILSAPFANVFCAV